MGMTTTLPASINLAAIGNTESGTGKYIANSGSTVFNFDGAVISVALTVYGQTTAVSPGFDFGTYSSAMNIDNITITAVGNGSTTLEIVSGSPSVTPTVSIPVTVGAVAEDESYLNKRGLTHFWENIDDIKQDKLTAGAGISISNNVISATGGGTADAVDWGHITGSMSNQTDLMTALGAKANSADLATVATSGSYNDLSDKPDIMTGLTEMSYGESNAWAKFIDAYRGHKIVYCRASSNSNPATGSQTRKAFMAYVNNADNPTEVEFQYVRSVSNKTASQPVDQVYVYKLTSANGGTWTVTTRDMGPKLAQGTNTTVSYSNGTYTISATGGGGGGPTVVQTTGQSTTDVMSQKAVTDIIGNVETILQTLNSGNGAQQ